jgi:hypothetical protein
MNTYMSAVPVISTGAERSGEISLATGRPLDFTSLKRGSDPATRDDKK